jgi:hypothetical protein
MQRDIARDRHRQTHGVAFYNNAPSMRSALFSSLLSHTRIHHQSKHTTPNQIFQSITHTTHNSLAKLIPLAGGVDFILSFFVQRAPLINEHDAINFASVYFNERVLSLHKHAFMCSLEINYFGYVPIIFWCS